MKRTLTITETGLTYQDGGKTKKVHIEGEHLKDFGDNQKSYTLTVGLIKSKDKNGKEVHFITKADDPKATVKKAYVHFKFKDGVCYDMVAKDGDKYINAVRIAGQSRDKSKTVNVEIKGKSYPFNAITLTREVSEEKRTIKDKEGKDKEITYLTCKLVEAVSKPAKAKETEKGEDLPF